MDETQDPAGLAEIEDLRDEIALKEAILESLDDNSNGEEDEELRKNSQRELKRLRKHLRALLNTPKEEEDDDTQRSRLLDQLPEATGDSARRESHPTYGETLLTTPPARFDLVSRKRQRDLYDDRPESFKSRRTTPISALTPASPAASTASLDSLDDPSLDSLFGLSKEEFEHNREYWSQKKQEEEDEKLAHSLSQEWASDDDVVEQSVQPTIPRHTDYTQSFLRSNGSYVKSGPTKSAQPFKSVKPDPGRTSMHLSDLAAYSSSSRVPVQHQSDNDLMSDQLERKPHMGESLSMPGAFPDSATQPSYSSFGGGSVYNPNGSAPLSLNGLPGHPTPLLGQQINDDFEEGNERVLRANEYYNHAQTETELRQLLQHIRPDEELTANQMPEQTPGLKVALMPHQLSGVAWMKRMEEGTNKGGILADDMGLGKTLQAIALMLERPPPAGQHRPTLVVAPVALLRQWKREIEKMVRPRYRLQVFILHGETRKANWSTLRAYDVILTTYGLLASELKRKMILNEKVKRLENYVPSIAEDCSVLGDRSKFHRVILDEAHTIKNRTTKGALAAYRIQADYRWCLTGTPMMNNTEEFYSLVKFLRIRPYCHWERFRRDIAQQLKRKSGPTAERAMATLQALLRAVLLRRTKQSTIHGQPILQLPPKETREDRVPFGEDQREFYFALERSSQVVMNRYIQAGSVGRHYANILVLLLRLRQACDHPYLVTASKDFIQLPGGELNTDALMRNAKKLDVKVVERLKELDAYECPICFDVTENPSLFFCGHAICGDCLSKLTDSTNDTGNPPKCPQCRANIDVNNVTDYTSFLRVHCPEHELVQDVGVDDDEVEADSDSDTDSDVESESDEGDDLGGFIVPDTDIDSGSDPDSKKPAKPPKTQKKKRSKSKGKAKAKTRDLPKSLAQLRREGLRSKAAKRKYLRRLKKTFEPSAKTTRTLELLQEIKDRGENEKTIIFSNFTSFLDIIEVGLYDKAAFQNYVRYDGSMSAEDRNDAVLEFTENPRCTIILVSLRAGNAGLNLTAANHVVMMDPFWNPFVEYQAADRCYRIGQIRPVTVHRVLIGKDDSEEAPLRPENKDPAEAIGGYTVEDRILSLQEAKRKLVETALDESAGQAVSRLGVRELGYLFGLNNL